MKNTEEVQEEAKGLLKGFYTASFSANCIVLRETIVIMFSGVTTVTVLGGLNTDLTSGTSADTYGLLKKNKHSGWFEIH